MFDKEKIDRRIRRSKKSIQTALIRLLAHKNLENITITEIAKEADVNRKTFYNNYENIYQVIEEIENDIVNSFDEILLKINIEENLQQPLKLFGSLTRVIQKDFEGYNKLVQAKKVGEISLLSKIAESLKQRVKENIPLSLFQDQLVMELSIDYIIVGMMEIYRKWLQNPKEVSLEKLTNIMSVITFSGLNGIIGEKL